MSLKENLDDGRKEILLDIDYSPRGELAEIVNSVFPHYLEISIESNIRFLQTQN